MSKSRTISFTLHFKAIYPHGSYKYWTDGLQTVKILRTQAKIKLDNMENPYLFSAKNLTNTTKNGLFQYLPHNWDAISQFASRQGDCWHIICNLNTAGLQSLSVCS